MEIRKYDKLVTKTIDTPWEDVVKYLIDKGITISTAESCTGGMISQMITSVAGASEIFPGGICTYSEQVKQETLGVKKQTLERYTVYSPQVASEMSLGAQRLFKTQAAVGVTGVAGPGSAGDKPAGTVYVSVRLADKEEVRDLKVYELVKDPDRETVRRISSQLALKMVFELCINSGLG
ncbi:MAG: CinA family protein [Ruminococcus sp.]|nr:CinA family protein [Ruminococcus sp.]